MGRGVAGLVLLVLMLVLLLTCFRPTFTPIVFVVTSVGDGVVDNVYGEDPTSEKRSGAVFGWECGLLWFLFLFLFFFCSLSSGMFSIKLINGLIAEVFGLALPPPRAEVCEECDGVGVVGVLARLNLCRKSIKSLSLLYIAWAL